MSRSSEPQVERHRIGAWKRVVWPDRLLQPDRPTNRLAQIEHRAIGIMNAIDRRKPCCRLAQPDCVKALQQQPPLRGLGVGGRIFGGCKFQFHKRSGYRRMKK